MRLPVQHRSALATLLVVAFAACAGDGVSPTTLNQSGSAGGVSAGLSGSSVTAAGGGAGAEYALVAFNGATSSLTRASVTVTPTGVTAPSSSLSSQLATGGFAAVGSLGVATEDLAGAVADADRAPSVAFHATLRAIESRELAPRLGAARAWQAARAARAASSSSGAPRLSVLSAQLTVGSTVTLNANANSACASPVYRTGRVAAVGSKAIVIADASNPAGGFTDAEYAAIAAQFDTLVHPTDVAAFGEPTDIDGNGHVVLFFTRAVNALTPRDSKSYVSGFFFGRDLFPNAATDELQACAGSNFGEMFYLLVPDPTGTVNGNTFSKSYVQGIIAATIAHEYEHLINASRRVYVNTAATDFEDTWLDEGLAHVAEELVFYEAAGLAPNRNLDATTIRSSALYKNAFNTHALSNFGRLELLLESPSPHSPFADDDSLQTRGATWSFLRYAADQTGTSTTAWSKLVNSSSTGMANLRAVFGSDVGSLARDWATSLVADDVSGAAARYQQPSWNLRSLYGALTSAAYPLATTALANGVASSATLAAGGAAYFRFAVPAGQSATIAWGTLPSGVGMTLVRLR